MGSLMPQAAFETHPSLKHTRAFAPKIDSNDGKTNLIGLSRADMAEALSSLNLPSFRVKQVWQWIYAKGVHDFSNMTNLSKPLRERLEESFTIKRPSITQVLNSRDGTAKWLLCFNDDSKVETVHIPEADRGTLCVSSQVGCTLTCRFCHTGTQRLVRNLSAEEIVGQVMLARDAFGEWPAPKDGAQQITNIVLMGMGEPLYNYENVAKALKIIMDPEGLMFSKRKITLSTSGVVPEIRRCGTELNVNLAISLHAVNDTLRNQLMPINNKYPLKELMRACHEYPGLSNARRITFEYVMLKDVNDSDADARALVQLLKGIPAKVNLIPFNPWEGSCFECSNPLRIVAFQEILARSNLSAPIRTTRGEDIMAACGQLKSASERLRKSQRDV